MPPTASSRVFPSRSLTSLALLCRLVGILNDFRVNPNHSQRDSLNNFEVLHKLTTRRDRIAYNGWFSTCSKSTSIRDVDINSQSSKNTSQKSLWPFSSDSNKSTDFTSFVNSFQLRARDWMLMSLFLPAKTFVPMDATTWIDFPTRNLKDTLSTSRRGTHAKKCFHVKWKREAKHFYQAPSNELSECTNERNCSRRAERRRGNCILVMQKRSRRSKEEGFVRWRLFGSLQSSFPFPNSTTMLYANDKRAALSNSFSSYSFRIQRSSRNVNFARKNCQKKCWRS